MKTRLSKECRAAAFGALMLVLIFAAGTLEARLVGQVEARTAAARLLEIENSRPDLRLTLGSFALVRVEPLLYHDRPVAYLIRLMPRGFMILADITEVSPQVFISYEGDPELLTRHPFLVRILDRLEYDKVHLNYLAANVPGRIEPETGEVPDPVQMKRNEMRWSDLGRESLSAAVRVAESWAAAAVGPLLTSKWNQDAPYWNFTPTVGGQHTYTGCSATAMAQVMYYWKHPSRGQGSHSYQWNGTTLSANFNHEYLWTQMRASYSGDYTAAQAAAVARLMSDVGIAVDMGYGVDGSGAWPNDNNAYTAFFKYSPDARFENRADAGSWAAWFNVIRLQMDVHQPAVMAIYQADSGHAVVADGYRTSPSNQLHINMGWGGYADNYYSVDNIYGYGDAQNDYAVVGIHPMQVKLTLISTAGGTTNPPPGVYPFAYGTTHTIRATALPQTHYSFIGWTGDATGTWNPIDVVVNMEKTVTANFQRNIYAPLNATGQKVLNRSFSQAEYINIIKFEDNPDNVDINSYKIYRVEGGERTLVTYINYGNPLEYAHRGVTKDTTYTYHIIAMNNDFREGDAAVVVIQ
ncbi:MAG: C10 family peptidase [Candidatus Aminicenantes bacterium]|nr:C10 family peptidase [Candidatus Aminicenantes bacterium]